MKIFITGATGVLGRRAVKLLQENNHQVIALARSKESAGRIAAMNIEAREGDLFDAQKIIELTSDCESILHLATKIPTKQKPIRADWLENDRIRTEGTQNLLAAALTHKMKLYLQECITFIYGDQKGKIVTTESAIPSKQIPALESAVKMEELIRASKVPFIILRFGTFYSEDAWHTKMILEAVRKRMMPMISNGDFYWNMIHADDAASAVVYAVNNYERFVEKTFNVTDYTPIQYKDFISILVKKTGSKSPMKMPGFLLKLMMGKDTFEFLTNSYRIAGDKNFAEWKPKYESFEKGIDSILTATSS